MIKLGAILKETLLDGTKYSFGRTWSIPFIVSAWVLATGQGALLLYEGVKAFMASGATSAVASGSLMDVVWGLALIGAMLYGGSKGLSVIRNGVEVKAGTAAEGQATPRRVRTRTSTPVVAQPEGATQGDDGP